MTSSGEETAREDHRGAGTQTPAEIVVLGTSNSILRGGSGGIVFTMPGLSRLLHSYT